MSILDRFRLTNKRLFITAGSRGLGREMALACADAGADCVLVGREAASLDKTATDIRALGRQAHTISADVGKPADCEAACHRALRFGDPSYMTVKRILENGQEQQPLHPPLTAVHAVPASRNTQAVVQPHGVVPLRAPSSQASPASIEPSPQPGA